MPALSDQKRSTAATTMIAGAIAWTAVPLALAWVANAWWLGRNQERLSGEVSYLKHREEQRRFADIIAVRGNPVDDVTALTRVAWVMKGGKVYKNELTGAAASR